MTPRQKPQRIGRLALTAAAVAVVLAAGNGRHATANAAITTGVSPFDGWKPHAYCNDLAHIAETKIAPLTPEQAARVVSLEHVQVVARHGARVPYARVFCWDGAGHDPVGATWNCGQGMVSSQNIDYKAAGGYGRLYTKTYLDGANLLNGTCVIGALLPEGREQHLINGEHLRAAYIGDGPLKLFSSADLNAGSKHSIYLRSDDQERTVGSGHALMDGLFPPEQTDANVDAMLTWHVTDYSVDHMSTNDRNCPMMSYIGNVATGSATFQKHLKDPATHQLEKDFQRAVGNFSWDTILECLSIARCNDMGLPKGVNESLFTSVFHEVEVRQGLYLTFNESWFAKVAMQPLVAEMLAQIDPAVKGSPEARRLSIFLAHDSTLMPLLAAIQRDNWDRTWTPYAGMMTIEVYKTKDNGHAARLLFKGQPQRIPECEDTLCDMDDFLKAFEFGRTPRDCEAPEPVAAAAFSFGKFLSTVVLVAVVVACAYLGLRHRREERRRHTQEERGLLA